MEYLRIPSVLWKFSRLFLPRIKTVDTTPKHSKKLHDKRVITRSKKTYASNIHWRKQDFIKPKLAIQFLLKQEGSIQTHS